MFISHFIEDVLEICDRVTILRDGCLLECTPAAELTKHYVIHKCSATGWPARIVGYETGRELASANGGASAAACYRNVAPRNLQQRESGSGAG